MAEITEESFASIHNQYAERTTKPEGIEMGEVRKLQTKSKHEKIVSSFLRKTMPIGTEIDSVEFIRNKPLENIVDDHVKHQTGVIHGISHTMMHTLDEKGENVFYEEEVPLPEGTKKGGYRFLYHGTSFRAMRNIISSPSGFDPLRCTRSLHGRGNYFSSEADYSLNYSPVLTPETDGMVIKEILLVKVFVGLYQKGSPNKPADHIGINSVKHNTLVNDLENPTIFVTQSSSQQVPCYRITVKIPAPSQPQSGPGSKVPPLSSEDEHIRAVIISYSSKLMYTAFRIDKDNDAHMILYNEFSKASARWYALLIRMSPGIISLDQKIKHSMAMEYTTHLMTTVIDSIKNLLTSKCITGTVEDFVSPYLDVLCSGINPSISPAFRIRQDKFWVDFFKKYSKILVDTLKPVVKREPVESSQLGGPAKKVKSK